MNNSVMTTKLFYPLSGPELALIIQNALKESLAGSQLLQPHLTFPKATFTISLTIDSYPMSYPDETRIERTLEIEGAKLGEAKTETITLSRSLGETQETAPDALREEANLPIPRAVRDPETGRHTDAPVAKITVGAGTVPRGRATKVTVGKAADEAFLGDPVDVQPNTTA